MFVIQNYHYFENATYQSEAAEAGNIVSYIFNYRASYSKITMSSWTKKKM